MMRDFNQDFSASEPRTGNFVFRGRRQLRRLLDALICSAGGGVDPNRGRLMLESLERRQLLAGDVELLFTDANADDALPPQPASEATQTSGQGLTAQPEGEQAPDLVQFAKDLVDAGTQFFGAAWCPFCTQQKELFADGGNELQMIEVTNPDRSLNEIGVAENISTFPTWEFPDGSRETGVLSLDVLSQRSGVAIPQSEQPVFEPIGDFTVPIGSPVHIPIDAYDPDGGPLTVSVSVDDPSLVEATVLSGNRSIRVDMTQYGDMVFELFEQRAPRASGRVIELAEDNFYDGIIFHRVIDNFVIQGGDPTGTGAGGSDLGDFDDDFHPELQHNRNGVLSFAKSSDDTNDSQFFVTDVATRFLDFNHSVFGQMVEGFDVLESISSTSTPASRGTGNSDRPDNDVTIESIDVFTDSENSLVMFKATGNGTGTTNATITVTDQDGNTFSETVAVTVAADTANSQPFLNEIQQPVVTTTNTPAELQLTSVDIEGDAVTYFAQALSNSANGTVAVDSSTGVVTVTPANGFDGTIEVQVGVRPGPNVTGNGTSDSDTQTVEFRFEGEALTSPSAVDLQAGSDSGSSDSDNITNVGSLSFDVSGVRDGATVQLVNLNSGGVIGSEVASGNSVTITTTNLAALGDGEYNIAARQILGDETSEVSSAISVRYDTTAPAEVTGSALTQANVGRDFLTDLLSSEEGDGLTYELTAAPTGATIDASTGIINWTPASDQTGSNAFTIRQTDAAGNVRTETFEVNVAGPPLAEVRLEVTDEQGNAIDELSVGQTFLLNFVAVDARSSGALGVFGAYTDVLFDSNLVRPEPGSAIEFDPDFTLVRRGTLQTSQIDELGAVSNSLVATQRFEDLIATVRMEALDRGTVTIRSEPADQSDSEFLLYGEDNQIPAESIAFGAVTLSIGASFTLAADAFTVDEDSPATSLDVLANDQINSGSSLSLVSVTQPASGGTVSLDGNQVRFTPEADFNGEAVFTYRAADANGVQDNASVTVTVESVNDPPVAVADSFTVVEGSSENNLNVLANDTIGPDSGETLTISDVSSGSNGATVTIASDGQSVLYTPAAGFTGSDSFTYTVSDGELTDQVTVDVTVNTSDNPPTANDDTFTNLTEDDGEAEFDVLSNDTRDADNQSFVLDAVGTPTQGGSARISADGTQFFYTPAADFNGTEEVTYTIRDTGGGLSVGTATFTVSAVNDPPPILDTTVTLNRATGQNSVFSLSELPENVDNNETLTISLADSSTTAGGQVAVSSDGSSILYTLPSDSFIGDDSFTYSISDGSSSRTGTINLNVADFTPRNITLEMPATALRTRVGGVVLKGTNLLGEEVSQEISYGSEGAVFSEILPGSYTIEIPAIPFLQNGDSPRQISLTSEADDGDATVDSEIGLLKSKFVSILDFLGSTPRKSMLVAVAPGEPSLLSLESSTQDTVDDPVVELSSDGDTVVIRGTQSDGTTEEDVTASLPVGTDERVQIRGEADGLRLMRISLEESDVSFSPVNASSAASTDAGGAGDAGGTAAEGEQLSASLLAAESLGQAGAVESQITVGDVQAEGEELAALAASRADVFVPATSQISTRTDAVALPTEKGELWLGDTMNAAATKIVDSGADDAVDLAMENVAERLSVEASAADDIVEGSSTQLGEEAIDSLLSLSDTSSHAS